MVRERSRSHDDDSRRMWGNPNPDRPHDTTRTGRWNYTPALRRIRRVLLLVDLTQTKQCAMSVKSCEQLCHLQTSEEMALFTYAQLLNPSQLQTT